MCLRTILRIKGKHFPFPSTKCSSTAEVRQHLHRHRQRPCLDPVGPELVADESLIDSLPDLAMVEQLLDAVVSGRFPKAEATTSAAESIRSSQAFHSVSDV